MTAHSISTLAQDDLRLRRRLESTSRPNAAEVLPLVRACLVARGYQSVIADLAMLDSVSPSQWSAHGFTRVEEGVWKAEPWLPTWLDTQGVAPDQAIAQRAQRRPNWSFRADRFYTKTVDYVDYLSPGQKAAVRAVSVAQAGDSIIIVLPTGSGKTEVVLSRAIHDRPRQTCIVTPTVSLALDLERRVHALTGEALPLAYHGGLASQEKAEFAGRVREGSQWLTITSPEAACTVLATPLEVAATEGRLALLAIDEAHIVAEWGDDFRPAFQTLAGMRRRLIEVAPRDRRPVTVMMTATLDDYGLQALRRLFPGGRELFVSAQVTRPEPAWWIRHCEDEDQKRERLLELCRNLPKPIIVYTTLHTSERSTNVQTALTWLRESGLRAVAGVVGGATAEKRASAAMGLRLDGAPDQDIDVVVATSAFGLGIDISSIRAVIHLCVPESVDRLYQEVGRGGRDGRASGSFVLWTDADARVASGMAEAKLIGDKLAWKRWERMSLGRAEGDLIRVDLTAFHDEVTYPWSDANRYWNVQTLSAMDRARMIALEWPTPADVPSDSTDEELQDIFAARRATTAVRVLQGDLADESAFRRRIRQAQRESHAAAAASVTSANEILGGVDICLNKYLARHYGIKSGSNLFGVSSQCGGCPHCRAARRPPEALSEPEPALFDGGLAVTADQSLLRLGRGGRLCVWTDGKQPEEEQELVNRLVDRGVVALVSLGPWAPVPRVRSAVWWEDRVSEWLQASDHHLKVPTLVRINDEGPPDLQCRRLLARLSRHPLVVVLTTRDRLDPSDDRKFLRESWGIAYRIDHLLRRL